MGELKASYIFTKPEMLFVLNSVSLSPACPMQYLLNEYFSGMTASQEAVDGLEYKKLISITSGKVTLEPVIHLLARSALSAGKLWIINKDEASRMFILKSDKVLLHIKSYPLIDGAWRIAPYKTISEMMDEFEDVPVISVSVIDHNGEKTHITSPKDFTWLEE